MYKVLMIEDEFHLRRIVKDYFKTKDILVIEACQGYEGLDFINEDIDIVLLDIMMPGIDGYEVCRLIREKYEVPIIFISALSEEDNQLKAYELGADDYITKPFKLSILYAKIMAMIKRDQKPENQILTFSHIQIDTINHILIVDNEPFPLAYKEYELMMLLCQHHGQLLPREMILEKIWGYDYYGDGRSVDTYIKKLRKKLGKYSHYIQTIIKTGYMFKVVDDNEKNENTIIY